MYKYLLLLVSIQFVSCQDILSGTYFDGNDSLSSKYTFLNLNLQIEGLDNSTGQNKVDNYPIEYQLYRNIQIIKIEGISYIIIRSDIPSVVLLSDSRVISLYKNRTDANISIPPVVARNYTSSSELTEGSNVYSVQNLRTFSKNWATSVNGGVGESIRFTYTGELKRFFIGNGFLSPSNPGLYFENSRIKQIRITIPALNYSIVKELNDTYQIQEIILDGISYQNRSQNTTVNLEIISTYPGEKYQDLCAYYLRVR